MQRALFFQGKRSQNVTKYCKIKPICKALCGTVRDFFFFGGWGNEPFNFEKLQGPDVKYKHRPIPIKGRLMLRVAQTALLMLVYWYTCWINDNVSTIKSRGNGQMQWWLLGAVGAFLCEQVIKGVTALRVWREEIWCIFSQAYTRFKSFWPQNWPQTTMCFHRVASLVASYMTMIYWSFKKSNTFNYSILLPVITANWIKVNNLSITLCIRALKRPLSVYF